MAERLIRKLGDAALRKKCKPVTEITPRVLQLLDDMTETLREAPNGAALAAPQVGVLRNVVVINSNGGILELINPEIIASEGEQTGPEGCLSLPGIWGKVTRANYVKVQAVNRGGEKFEVEGKGFISRCLQHEIDHLDGTLFIDLIEPGQIFSEKTNEPLDVLNLIKISRKNTL